MPAISVGLATTIIWIAAGLDHAITARAITFLASIGAAVIVALLLSDRGQHLRNPKGLQ